MENSFLHILKNSISNSSTSVFLIIILLLFISIYSIAIIIWKNRSLKDTVKNNKVFKEMISKSKNNLFNLKKDCSESNLKEIGLLNIFNSAMDSFEYVGKNINTIEIEELKIGFDLIENSINEAIIKERISMSSNLSKLATIGSTAPYIGLIGTVTGVLITFNNLTDNSSISAIAPNISEALLVTAIGLMVSITSIVYYNQFASTIKDINSENIKMKLNLINTTKKQILKISKIKTEEVWIIWIMKTLMMKILLHQ